MKLDQRSPEAEAYRRWYRTRAWRLLRQLQLAEHPLCIMCEEQGILTPAIVADHREPHRGDPTRFFDANGLQSLCAQHHNSTKQREERSGRPAPVIGADGWPA